MKRFLILTGAFLLVFGVTGIAGATQTSSFDGGGTSAIDGDGGIDLGLYILSDDVGLVMDSSQGSGMGHGPGGGDMGPGPGGGDIGPGPGGPGQGGHQNNPVPEPATMLLLGVGLAGMAGAARKKMFRK